MKERLQIKKLSKLYSGEKEYYKQKVFINLQ